MEKLSKKGGKEEGERQKESDEGKFWVTADIKSLGFVSVGHNEYVYYDYILYPFSLEKPQMSLVYRVVIFFSQRKSCLNKL